MNWKCPFSQWPIQSVYESVYYLSNQKMSKIMGCLEIFYSVLELFFFVTRSINLKWRYFPYEWAHKCLCRHHTKLTYIQHHMTLTAMNFFDLWIYFQENFAQFYSVYWRSIDINFRNIFHQSASKAKIQAVKSYWN